MLVTLLILAPFGLALAVLSLPASRRRQRRVSAAGGPPAPSARPRAAEGAAVPAITGLPEREERQPFGTSGIVTAGEGRREAAKP